MPRFRWVLLTNSFEKLDTPHSIDIEAGGFRGPELTAAPYHLRGAYVLYFSSPPCERIRTMPVME